MTEHSDRLRSALADRYAIEAELGSGGMAVVYLARDRRHDRQVAVKVLRPELAAAVGGDRFLREIKLTAKLNHPHILPLLDSGEADGFLYYVMPYVAGESLREQLERETQLPVVEALRITQQVASALEFAHKQGVIHRDIKPENILLHEGVAMVADFGIALAVSAAGGERLTETGVSVGTVEYMSPEQALGEGEPDARSDIYSLGCVLYKMLVGEPPYTGPTGMAVLAKRLSDPVPRARRLRAAIPEAVDTALVRALARERADRFGSVREFAEALVAEAVEDQEAAKSIVVVPFTNLSPDPENEYFSDGLTEEIITDLSKVHDLLVISRSSAMTLKGSKKRAREIAREVDVRYVLEGSVRKAGKNLRITAQLIDAERDAHLWAEKYSGTMDDIFEIQESVSRSIVDALKIELSAEEKRNMALRPIEDVEAYEYYLKATAATYRTTEAGMSEALRHFQLALDAIGDNALLYSGIAYIHFFLMNIGVRIEENRTKALEYVQKALALDPEMPKARALLGWLTMFYRGDLEDVKEGARHLKRALEADPNEFQALWGLTVVYLYVGRISAAHPLAMRLRRIEPLDPLSLWLLGGVYYNDARYDLALQEFRRLYEMDPEHPWWRAWYAWMLAYDGQIDEAAAIMEQSARRTPEDMHTKLALMQLHGLRRDGHAARNEMTDDFREWCWSERAWSACLSTAFALLDEREEALDWLEHAIESGNINFPLFSEKDPWLENIRGEERFRQLMVRVRKEWEDFEI